MLECFFPHFSFISFIESIKTLIHIYDDTVFWHITMREDISNIFFHMLPLYQCIRYRCEIHFLILFLPFLETFSLNKHVTMHECLDVEKFVSISNSIVEINVINHKRNKYIRDILHHLSDLA
jgi:hypothetical protein